MLKKLIPAILGLSLLGGCIVHTRTQPAGRGRAQCRPAHHWDNGRCVHNGKGRGNGKKDKVIIHDNRR